MIAYLDKDFNFIRTNKAYAEYKGKDPEYFVGKNYFNLFPSKTEQRIFSQVIKTGRPHSISEKLFRNPKKEAVYWDWNLSPVKGENNKIKGIMFSLIDVTKKRKAREEVRRVNRALRVLSKCNHAIAQADDELSLLRSICRIIVEKKRYSLRWIGFSEYNQRKSSAVSPNKSKLNWFREKIIQGLNEYAMKTGRVHVSSNYSNDSDRRSLKKYSSSLSLPIKIDEKIIGVINISSDDPEFFNEKERKLLIELVTNLSFGIKNLRERKEKEKMKKNLIESYKYLGTINRKISILMELERPQLENKKQNSEKVLEYILHSAINLSRGKMSAIYKYNEKDNEFVMLDAHGVNGEFKKSVKTITEKKCPIFKKIIKRKRIQVSFKDLYNGTLKGGEKIEYVLIFPLILKKKHQLKGFLLLGFSEDVTVPTQELDFYDVLGIHITSSLLNAEII